jgi:hypothetical protein
MRLIFQNHEEIICMERYTKHTHRMSVCVVTTLLT